MIRLAVRVARERSELVLAELLELVPSGVEEVDKGEGVVEYAVYGAPGELPALPELEAAAGEALVEVSTSEVADDWAERWRSFHRPLMLGHALAVRPPWEPPTGAAVEVVIDPGRAFGTGAHATTRLCLELLLGLPHRGGFVDVGCGSGVLAVAAAALGFGPVLALDAERAAVETTIANAAINGVELKARRFDVRAEAIPAAHQTVAANLHEPLLAQLARRLPADVERLIASGVLADAVDRTVAVFAAAGLRPVRTPRRGEWAAILFERPTDRR